MAAYSPIYTSVANVQAKTGLSNTEVDLTDDDNVRNIIEDAEVEVELLTGRKFTATTSHIDYINIGQRDIIDRKQTNFNLRYYPITSITEFLEVDVDGNTVTTFDTLSSVEISAGTYESEDYWVEIASDHMTNEVVPYGKVTMKTKEFSKGTHKLKVTYTTGYSSVPVAVRDLATCLAAIRLWIRFASGCYNFLNSYSIPQQSVNKGDFYQRAKQNIDMLTEEANRLLDRIGRKPRTLFFATGGTR